MMSLSPPLSEIVSPYVLAVAEELLVVVVVPEHIDAAFSMAALESTGDPLPPRRTWRMPISDLQVHSLSPLPRANTPSLGDPSAIILPYSCLMLVAPTYPASPCNNSDPSKKKSHSSRAYTYSSITCGTTECYSHLRSWLCFLLALALALWTPMSMSMSTFSRAHVEPSVIPLPVSHSAIRFI
jgi:hypothetical protein